MDVLGFPRRWISTTLLSALLVSSCGSCAFLEGVMADLVSEEIEEVAAGPSEPICTPPYTAIVLDSGEELPLETCIDDRGMPDAMGAMCCGYLDKPEHSPRCEIVMCRSSCSSEFEIIPDRIKNCERYTSEELGGAREVTNPNEDQTRAVCYSSQVGP